MSNIITFDGKTPEIHESCFTAPSADIIGDVKLAEGANVWYNATIRGDVNYIRIGKNSSIQDNCVVHVDSPKPENPNRGNTVIGDNVTIGHSAVIHACIIEDACLIGMGSVILNGAVIGKGSIVGAGAVVTPGTVIPPFSMVLGAPGKVVKTLPQGSLDDRLQHAKWYRELAEKYDK